MKSYTVNEISRILKGELVGETNQRIDGPEELERAKINHITFIGSRKYVRLWDDSKACAAIVDEKLDIEPGKNRALIRVKNADLAMAKLLEVFDPGPPEFDVGIHPAAIVHESANIGNGCKIGAGCYLGKDVTLGDNVELFPNVTILDETKIGNSCLLYTSDAADE